MAESFLFRGCDKLYFGDVTETVNASGVATLTFTTPEKLAAVKEVGKTTASDSATHYGDNKGLVVVNSEGDDEITFSVFGISPDVLAKLTGKTFNESNGMYINNQRTFTYKYVMWREKLTTGKYRYNIAYKGSFNIPETTVAGEDDGTDANGQDLTFKSVFTEKEFSDGKASKGYFIDTTYNENITAETFFAAVKTQDEYTA